MMNLFISSISPVRNTVRFEINRGSIMNLYLSLFYYRLHCAGKNTLLKMEANGISTFTASKHVPKDKSYLARDR